MFIVLSPWQSHCVSSLGSSDECKAAPSGKRLPTFRPSQPTWTWAVGTPVGCTPNIHHHHLLLYVSITNLLADVTASLKSIVLVKKQFFFFLRMRLRPIVGQPGNSSIISRVKLGQTTVQLRKKAWCGTSFGSQWSTRWGWHKALTWCNGAA